MNKYGIGVILAVMVVLTLALALSLKYSQATLLFGFVALVSAPIVIHRIPDKNWSMAMLFVLAIFASFPFRKLYQIDGFIREIPVLVIYVGILWLVGRGWKRSWQ